MGRHQPSRPEPHGQGLLGAVHNRARGHRSLTMAVRAFPRKGLGLQRPALLMFATRAAKPFGPPLARKISGAGRLVWKLSLKFYQSARMIGHESPPNSVCSLFVLRDRSHPVTTYCGTGTKRISLNQNSRKTSPPRSDTGFSIY